MALQSWVEQDDGVALMHLRGDLDSGAAPYFREEAAVLVGSPAVVFDLEGVPFIDSAGLGALIGAIRRVRDGRGDAVVCSSGKAITRLLHCTGLDRVVLVARSGAEAHAYFESPRRPAAARS